MDRARRKYRRGLIALAIGAVVLVALGPWATAETPTAGAHRGVGTSGGPAPTVAGIGATVRWGGTDIASGASPSAAIITSFTHTIDVSYAWAALAGINGPNLYNISTARVQFFYFGAALDTRDVVDSAPVAATNGSFDMQWQPGVFQYLFEGTFGLTASLIAPNGTTMWSQAFYIHAQAPGSILAALPIVLVLIGIYEGYGLATAGRQAATRSSRGGGSPRSPPSETVSPGTEGKDAGRPPE